MTGLGAPTLEALERAHPEWTPWLGLLRRARDAARSATWRGCRVELDPGRPEPAPVLARAGIAVDRVAAGRLAAELCALAARGPGPAATLASAGRRLDPIALLEAAVSDDVARLASLAATAAADAGALRAVGQALAMSVLQPCAAEVAAHVPPGWARGYCPVCGAWPTLAEERGLERARRLRCARCGADWWTAPLACPYCGSFDHTRLGSLRPQAAGDTRRVDTCASCRGYLKSVATLTALPAADVALADLATVELDVAALEQGYARPADPGYRLEARVGPRPGLARRLLGWAR